MKKAFAVILFLTACSLARVYGELDSAINQGNMLLADTLVNTGDSSGSVSLAEEFCSNYKTLDLCRSSLDSIPADSLMKFIQLLDKKGYLRFTEQKEYDTSYTAIFEKQGCIDKWNGLLANYKDEIYIKKNALSVNRFLGISVYSYYDDDRCDLSVSGEAQKDSLAKCYRMVTDFVEKKKNSECYESRTINERKTREVAVYPFKSAVARAREYLMNISWTRMNKEWLENIELLNRYEPLRYDFKGAFREGKRVPVDWAVASCLMNFGYNNLVNGSLPDLLPTCSELKDLYKSECHNEGEEIQLPVYLGDRNYLESYVCRNGVYNPNRQ